MEGNRSRSSSELPVRVSRLNTSEMITIPSLQLKLMHSKSHSKETTPHDRSVLLPEVEI